MYHTVFEQQESYQPWQPPKSLQIIPFKRIESCPASYTPETIRKAALKPPNEKKIWYARKPGYIEQYRDNTQSKLMLKKQVGKMW